MSDDWERYARAPVLAPGEDRFNRELNVLEAEIGVHESNLREARKRLNDFQRNRDIIIKYYAAVQQP